MAEGARQQVEVGSSAGVRFEVEWLPAPDRASPDATWGAGRVYVDDELVWGTESSAVTWSWAELLRWLTQSWAHLEFEETYPLGLMPQYPDRLRPSAEHRWEDLPQAQVWAEDEVLLRFESNHNASHAFSGMYLPPLFLMREGNCMWVWHGEDQPRLDAVRVLSDLEAIGDFLARRAGQEAVVAWNQRPTLTTRHVRAAILRADPDDLEKLESSGDHSDALDYWEAKQGEGPSELLAVARMVGGSLVSEMGPLLEIVRSTSHVETALLDALSEKARACLDQYRSGGQGRRPHEEGHYIAQWLRAQIGNAEQRIDPLKILSNWGIAVKTASLLPNLDAVAVWGPLHGPVIVANQAKKGVRRRSTLAHEICHLLLDRHHALPMAEVFGGLAPKLPEQRARAFAAELLLPTQVVADMVRDAQNVDAAFFKRLCSRFGVGTQLAAWQVRNGDAFASLTHVEKRQVEERANDL